MHLKNSKGSLRKIVKICCRNEFFNLQSIKNSATSINYGPVGSLFRKNICREWVSSIINNVDLKMFPIEIVKSRNLLNPSLSKSSTFLPDAFENYIKTSPSVPCGYAAYGPSLDWHQNTNIYEVFQVNSILRNFKPIYPLCVVFFCPIKKSSDWFSYWTRYRYRWWRKFSSIPSKFSMSDVTETVTGDQQLSLMMEFPWGTENLETIIMHKDNFFHDVCHAMSHKPGQNPDLAVIVCETELNMAAFAYLSNSFAEKWRNEEIRKLLQLHTKLAPYKVCICIKSDIPDDIKILKDVANHLEKEIKKFRVAIYQSCDTSISKSASYFSRYDEMGIPYTIVLDEKAVHLGIAHLRNRDTTLEEQVHITELTPKLLKYLHMNSFYVDES